jgi:malonyl-CoA O-methyltransferase
MANPPDIDRMAVMRQFDRRAPRFERADYLFREVERRMLERLDLVRLQPARLLDVGCGLGDGARRLRSRYPQAQAIGIDLSAALVTRARAIDRPSLGDRARSPHRCRAERRT